MTLFEQFEIRRRALLMSESSLARRSGVSLPTVHRVLVEARPDVSFGEVSAIAGALGLRLSGEELLQPDEWRRKEAAKAARRIVRLVQGTSALEGQGLEHQELERMVERTTGELLAADRELWSA